MTDTPKRLLLIPKNPPHPWARQRNETDKAFEAFCCYRDLPTSERSVSNACNILGKSIGTLQRWVTRYHWTDRVAAYQDFLNAATVEAQVEAIRKLHEEDRKRERDLGLSILKKVNARLNDRKHPVKLTDAQIPGWARQGVEFVRISDGLSMGKNEMIVKGGGEDGEIIVQHRFVLVEGITPPARPMREIPSTLPGRDEP